MKKLTTLLAVLFAATLAYAGEEKAKDKDRDTTKEITRDVKDAAKDVKNEVKDKTGETTAEAQAESKAKAAKNTHEVEAEVVSIDSTKNTITLKTSKGESTAPVEGKAQAMLKDFKPGQKVKVVCRDDDKGEHKAVTEIKSTSTTSQAK